MVIMGLLCGQYGVLCWWTVVWWALTSHNNAFEIILGWHHQLTWIDWWLRYLEIVPITWWKEAMMVKHKAKIRKSCRHPILKRAANRKYISRPISRPISRTISIFTEIISRESVAFVSAKPCQAMPSHAKPCQAMDQGLWRFWRPPWVQMMMWIPAKHTRCKPSKISRRRAIPEISGRPRKHGASDASGPPLWRKNHCFIQQKSHGKQFFLGKQN